MELTKQNLATKIDHTNLKPTATEADIRKVCAEAREYGFASVCANPVHVPLMKQELEGSKVLVCCVVGFPLGANTKEIKATEARTAVEQGADEVDMVINIGALKAGQTKVVQEEIAAVVDAAAGQTVKVIIETCYLTDEEKRIACGCAKDAGAHFVKTSTGFGSGGATVEDIKLMRQAVGEKLQVKASGGIRSLEDAKAMIDAGADRIGASAGIAIVNALPK